MRRGDLILLGTRGSYPVANASFLKYGGNTLALALPLDTTTLIVDGGTGIVDFGRELAGDKGAPRSIDLLFTHFHHDHVCGLLSFLPLYRDGFNVTIHLERSRMEPGQRALKTLFGSPYRPVVWDDLAATISFAELERETNFDGVAVTRHALRHPGGSTGYRLDGNAGSVALVCDYEHPPEGTDEGLVDFCRGAGTILYDSNYTPGEYEAYRGWGHSTWEEGLRLRERAGPGQLVLIHHDPVRDDDGMDRLMAAAREIDPGIVGGREGMVFPVVS